jgi:hypothetical protein
MAQRDKALRTGEAAPAGRFDTRWEAGWVESLKTSDARWRESIASGSAFLMSSPGACVFGRVGVGCSPIGLAADAGSARSADECFRLRR